MRDTVLVGASMRLHVRGLKPQQNRDLILRKGDGFGSLALLVAVYEINMRQYGCLCIVGSTRGSMAGAISALAD